MSVAGRKNKPKSAMLRMLQEKYGKEFHPIMELAKIANSDEADLAMKFNANKELCQYVVPKLRAVEVKQEVSGDLRLSVPVDWVHGTDS